MTQERKHHLVLDLTLQHSGSLSTKLQSAHLDVVSLRKMTDGRGDHVGSAGLHLDRFGYFSFFPFRLMPFVEICFQIRLHPEFHIDFYVLMPMHLLSDDNLI